MSGACQPAGSSHSCPCGCCRTAISRGLPARSIDQQTDGHRRRHRRAHAAAPAAAAAAGGCCCCWCDAPHEGWWIGAVLGPVGVSLQPHDALDVFDEALLGADHGAGPADADVADDLLSSEPAGPADRIVDTNKVSDCATQRECKSRSAGPAETRMAAGRETNAQHAPWGCPARCCYASKTELKAVQRVQQAVHKCRRPHSCTLASLYMNGCARNYGSCFPPHTPVVLHKVGAYQA